MRIVISGYFGFANPGDEAILEANIRLWKKLAPGRQITVLSQTPEETSRQYGVKAIYRRDFRKIYSLLGKDTLFLSGGGGVLQDVTGVKSIVYYLNLLLMAKIRGAKTMIFAQGIGPINTGLGKFYTRLLLNRVDKITVRDEESKKLLEKIGVKKPVAVTGDLALALEAAPNERISEIMRKEEIPAERQKVAFSIRRWPGIKPEFFAEAAKKLAEEFKLFPVFIPFQSDQDKELCEQAQNLAGAGMVLKGDYPASELMGLFGQMEITVGMRFHSLVFSVLNCVPALGIAYDPKVKNLLSRIGLPVIELADLYGEFLYSQARWVYLRREEFRESLKAKIPLFKKRAAENHKLALELFG